MGKIFDALEKASRQSNLNRSSSAGNKNKMDKDRSGNAIVVPFGDPKMPIASRNIDSNLAVYHNPQSVEAELFKVLKTNLLFPSSGKPPKTVLVTSSIPGDGKSFVSANLAVSIAQGIEEHAMLIDADIRNPSIDGCFNLGQAEGLSEYLSSGKDISQYFHKSAVDKLTIVPAGRPPSNPTELLTTHKMKELLSEVALRYEDRYIVIDSAPPSMAPETAAIAKYVDGIIIVVKAGHTPRNAISEVIEQLGKEKILGLVLNHSDQSVKKYYGYGKPYYKTGTD